MVEHCPVKAKGMGSIPIGTATHTTPLSSIGRTWPFQGHKVSSILTRGTKIAMVLIIKQIS